jgi:sugar lactone lactonase YvrE
VLVWAAVTTVVFGAASGAGFWWWAYGSERFEEPPPLPRDWPARVIVLAGDGTIGHRDARGERARFADPFGVAAAPDGTIFVTDAGDRPGIRAIAPDGTVSTVAGGEIGFSDGVGSAARFNSPSGIARATDGTLYVADTANNAIRRLSPDGRVTTIAGDGEAGDRDGIGREARFNGPIGVAVDARGRVIVADTYNDRIRAIEPHGTVSTLAGGPVPGLIDRAGPDARFDTPTGVALDRDGNILIADTGNDVLRRIAPDGNVTTTVSMVSPLERPMGIATGGDGEIYVSDERGRVFEARATGEWRLVAGSAPGFADGPGPEARFRRPSSLAFIAPGHLVVTDTGNALVRTIVASIPDRLRLPASPLIRPAFDVDAFARTALLWPVEPLEGPHEIAGTMGEARGGDGERFHAGIDVRIEDGTPVCVVRPGTVSSPLSASEFGTLNESVRVGTITYVHLRVGRTRAQEIVDAARFVGTYDERGRLSRIRIKRGARFSTGEPIGSVNAFNHVHLNVGWPGEEHNPLRFALVQFEDRVPPTIAQNGIRVYDEQGQPVTERANGRLVVRGPVQVVVDAWDQADGNRPSRRLGLYALGFQVLLPDGTPAPGFDEPRLTIRFDRLGDPDAPRLVYAPGSGIPFYGQRSTRFLYSITNVFIDGVAAPGLWDAGALPPGDYTLRIIAEDIRGNQAITRRDLPITIAAK